MPLNFNFMLSLPSIINSRSSGSRRCAIGLVCVLAASGAATSCITVHDPVPVTEGVGGRSGSSSGGTRAASAGSGVLDIDAGSGGAAVRRRPGTLPDSGAILAPGCLTSADCAPPNPYCDPATQACVQCLSSTNCANTGFPLCTPDTHQCVECLANTACPSTRPYCSPDGACVQCLSSRNCGQSGAVCDPGTYRCVSVCHNDGDCSATLGFPYCDVLRGECSQCLTDDECPAISPRCDTPAGLCVVCLSDADCSAATPHCATTAGKRCVACTTNGDCGVGEACDKFKCTPIPA